MNEPKHRSQDMSWAEFRQRLDGKPVMVLPMGAQEEQGPNAPLGDFVLAGRIAGAAVRRGGTVMAPVLPFGDSEFFRTLPGCMSLRPETLVAGVRAMRASLLEHGLTHPVMLNGQTGNAPHLDTATRSIKANYGISIPCIRLWRMFPSTRWEKLLSPEAASARTGHGGDPITSVSMHYFPTLSRPNLILERKPWKQATGLPTRGVSSVEFRSAPISMPLDIAEYVIDFAASFVAHFRAQDPRAA